MAVYFHLSLSHAPLITCVCPFHNLNKQTGAGKTYTMAGESQQDQGGVQPRALRALLAACRPHSSTKHKKGQKEGASSSAATTSLEEAEGTTRRMRVSVLEIYLEKVRDLLDARHGTAAEPKLEVRQDAEGRHDVPGLTSKEVLALAKIKHV